MNWVVSTFIWQVVITVVLNLIILGIYKLSTRNQKDEEED